MIKPELTYLATKSFLTWHRAQLGFYPSCLASSAEMLRLAAGATAACEEPPTLRGVRIVHVLWSKPFTFKIEPRIKLWCCICFFGSTEKARNKIRNNITTWYLSPCLWPLPQHWADELQRPPSGSPLWLRPRSSPPPHMSNMPLFCLAFSPDKPQGQHSCHLCLSLWSLAHARKSSVWPKVLLRCPNFRYEQPLLNGPAPRSGTELNLGQATSSSILFRSKSVI